MRRFAPLVLAVLLLGGCKTQGYVQHPGAVNAFDSQSYDSLLVTHSIIETTKADLAANKFPATISANVKTSLNNLITAYDVADSAYLAYHAAAVQGTATTAQATDVSNKIQVVTNATTHLNMVKGGQ